MYRYIVTLDVLFCCTVLPTRVSVTMNVQVHCYTGCVVLLYSVARVSVTMNVQVHCYTGCVVLLYRVANEGICHNECTGTLLHWMCCFVVHCYQRGYLSQ